MADRCKRSRFGFPQNAVGGTPKGGGLLTDSKRLGSEARPGHRQFTNHSISSSVGSPLLEGRAIGGQGAPGLLPVRSPPSRFARRLVCGHRRASGEEAEAQEQHGSEDQADGADDYGDDAADLAGLCQAAAFGVHGAGVHGAQVAVAHEPGGDAQGLADDEAEDAEDEDQGAAVVLHGQVGWGMGLVWSSWRKAVPGR